MAPEKLLTTKEVASLLRVSQPTLYRMLDRGQIPALRIGSRWRFDRRRVSAWLERSDTTTSQASAEGGVSR